MTFKRLLIDAAILVVILIFFASLAVASVSTRVYRSYDIGSKEDIMNRGNTGLTLYDRHDRIFFAFERARPGTFIELKSVPTHVRQAIIVSEDKTFLSHYGFSPSGILRSVYLNWEKQGLTYGGSTITQQLAKNSFLTPDKSLRRKYNELLLAIKLEQHFSKDDILEMYLNSAYFGEGVFGIEAAAQTYFEKTATKLTLAEASMLAAVLPEPSNLSPLSGRNIDRSKERQQRVLERMLEEEFISPEEKVLAQSEELIYNTTPSDVNRHAPHFALMVRNKLFDDFGEEFVIRSGFKVKTTLDLDWQQHTEKSLKEHVTSLARFRATNGAAVIIEPTTGEVLSLVGSIDWHNDSFGKINMAISPRQTGSSFKPIVYATALQERVITPSTILSDRPRTFGTNYSPRNYDHRFRGNILARSALANSVNVPAVEVMARTGPGKVIETAQSLGISTLTPESSQYLSTALGSESISLLELTGAYASFANAGKRAPVKTILSINDKYDDEVEYEIEEPRQVIAAGVAFQISSMLSDPQARAATFGNSLNLPFPAAVKTGTTQDYKDAWAIGYTPNLSIGIWIGNSNNLPMGNLPGATGAGPLWRNLMTYFHSQIPPDDFTPPPDVLAVKVCRHNGMPLRDDRQAGYTEYFLTGTKPSGYCVIPTPKPEPKPEEDKPEEEEKQIAGVQDEKPPEPQKEEPPDTPQKPPKENKKEEKLSSPQSENITIPTEDKPTT